MSPIILQPVLATMYDPSIFLTREERKDKSKC